MHIVYVTHSAKYLSSAPSSRIYLLHLLFVMDSNLDYATILVYWLRTEQLNSLDVISSLIMKYTDPTDAERDCQNAKLAVVSISRCLKLLVNATSPLTMLNRFPAMEGRTRLCFPTPGGTWKFAFHIGAFPPPIRFRANWEANSVLMKCFDLWLQRLSYGPPDNVLKCALSLQHALEA